MFAKQAKALRRLRRAARFCFEGGHVWMGAECVDSSRQQNEQTVCA